MPVASRTNRSVLDYEREEDLVQALQQSLEITPSSDEEPTSVVGLPKADWVLSNYDPETTMPQSVLGEAQRLKALKSYSILESERDEAFDRLTQQAAQVFNVPWACVSLIDMGRQWSKSMWGGDLEVTESPRKDAFCAHTVQLKDNMVLVVPDSYQDVRFRHYKAVTGSPGVRFYAGVPLVSPDGYKLGAFCIFDKEPRHNSMSDQEKAQLKSFAAETIKLIVERKNRLLAQRKRSASDAKDRQRHVSESSASSTSSESFPSSPLARKKSRTDISSMDQSLPTLPDDIIHKPRMDVVLPDPTTKDVDPGSYLVQLVEAIYDVTLKVKPALELQGYFQTITEEQMAAYNMEIVSIVRENKVDKLKEFFKENGRDSLDCFNRFGEGLLNMSSRRGFKDIVNFLLSPEVHLEVRISDDYGRTPMHDACWNPEPQLEICTWLMEQDPSLFLVSDKRGYTPFQYARKGDWHIWRQFLFDRREHLAALTRPEVLRHFA